MRALLVGLVLLGPPAGDVVATDPTPLAAGARGELSLTIRESPARALPLLARLEADDGVELLENRLSWGNVVDPAAERPRLTVTLTAPGEPGTYGIRGVVTYWVCDEKTCRKRTSAVGWQLRVTAPPA